ncbi:hypothetical protein BKA93DRAFT_706228, partial [Sparassis latifolia]
RMGDTGDPCGMPLITANISSVRPSRQTAVLRLERKDATQRMSGSGRCFWRSTERSRGWFTKSKNPLIS